MLDKLILAYKMILDQMYALNIEIITLVDTPIPIQVSTETIQDKINELKDLKGETNARVLANAYNNVADNMTIANKIWDILMKENEEII